MKATLLLIFAAIIANLWFANAKPLPPQLNTALNEEAVIEFLNRLSQEIKGTGTEVSEQGNDIDWPDHVDPPSFEKPAIQSSDADTPEKDEEKINQENGISKKPNVFGDIVLSPEQQNQLISDGEGKSQAVLAGALLWPDAVMPYVIDPSFHPFVVATIHAAMNELMQWSCIKFVPAWQGTPNYVHFFPGEGCYSGLGMTGNRQLISIGSGCEQKGIVQHEILHALGRIHEQSRLDRDQYVAIHLGTVPPDMQHNFAKMLSYDNFIPYDYGSIMHYDSTAFSVNPNIATIIPRVPGQFIGQRQGLSRLDWEHIRRMYCPFNSERQSVDQSTA